MIKKIGSFMDKAFWKQVNSTISKFEKTHPIIRIIIGSGLVIIGIIGIALPVLPGWIFLVPGLILMFPFLGKWLNKK